jgi:hypothetical protein
MKSEYSLRQSSVVHSAPHLISVSNGSEDKYMSSSLFFCVLRNFISSYRAPCAVGKAVQVRDREEGNATALRPSDVDSGQNAIATSLAWRTCIFLLKRLIKEKARTSSHAWYERIQPVAITQKS